MGSLDAVVLKLKSLAASVGSVLLPIYLLSAMCFGVYYNYQYAQGSGFMSWLLLGQIVPTAKGAVWPYFVYRDHQESVLRDTKRKYWEAFGNLPNFTINETELLGRVKDRMETQGREAALKLFADEIEKTLGEARANMDAIERIDPPSCYVALHADSVRIMKACIQSLTPVLSAMRSGDATALESARAEEKRAEQAELEMIQRWAEEIRSAGLDPNILLH